LIFHQSTTTEPTSCQQKTKSKTQLQTQFLRIKIDLDKWMKDESQILEGIAEWCKGSKKQNFKIFSKISKSKATISLLKLI
jgi:hypothetical protein